MYTPIAGRKLLYENESLQGREVRESADSTNEVFQEGSNK